MVMGPRINCSVFQKLKYFTLMLQENQKEISCKKKNLRVRCGVKAGGVTVVKPRPKSVKRLPVWSLL